MEMSIDYKAANEEITLTYSGTFTTDGISSIQDGVATITQNQIAFTQYCQSYYTEEGAYQLSSDTWTPVERTSPLFYVQQWLDMVQIGGGNYSKSIVKTNTLTDDTDGLPENLYSIFLSNMSFDPVAWCNAYFDASLGTAPVESPQADITLYFSTESNELSAIYIAAQTDTEAVTEALSATVLVRSASEKTQDVDTSKLLEEPLDEKVLQENWAIQNPAGTSGISISSEMETEILAGMKNEYRNQKNSVCYINGQYLTLPCSVQALIDAGFNTDISVGIDAGTSAMITFCRKEDIISVLVSNPTETELPIEDTTITALYFFLEEFSHTDVALPGGVTLNMDLEQIQQIWDTEDADIGLFLVNDIADEEYGYCYGTVYLSGDEIYCIGVEFSN